MWSENNFAMPSFLDIVNLESVSLFLRERKVIHIHNCLILPPPSGISICAHNYERTFEL